MREACTGPWTFQEHDPDPLKAELASVATEEDYHNQLHVIFWLPPLQLGWDRGNEPPALIGWGRIGARRASKRNLFDHDDIIAVRRDSRSPSQHPATLPRSKPSRYRFEHDGVSHCPLDRSGHVTDAPLGRPGVSRQLRRPQPRWTRRSRSRPRCGTEERCGAGLERSDRWQVSGRKLEW